MFTLCGGERSLVPELCEVMIRPLALVPQVADNWIARDAMGTLVGYTQFTIPRKFSESIVCYLLLLNW